MRNCFSFLGVAILPLALCSCGQSAKPASQSGEVEQVCYPGMFPPPRYEYSSSPEQGFWREVSSDEESIQEAHFTKGKFSITCYPFEVYKDYWGECEISEGNDRMRLTVSGVNRAPGYSSGTAKVTFTGDNQMTITGLPLDPYKPKKTRFTFTQEHKPKPTPPANGAPDDTKAKES